MKPADVKPEWVTKFLAVYHDGPPLNAIDSARAALAAVIPLIQEEEREVGMAEVDAALDAVPKPRTYEMAHYCMGLEAAVNILRSRGEP